MCRRGLLGLLGAGLIAGSALVAGCDNSGGENSNAKNERIIEHHEEECPAMKSEYAMHPALKIKYDVVLLKENAQGQKNSDRLNNQDSVERLHRIYIQQVDSVTKKVVKSRATLKDSLPAGYQLSLMSVDIKECEIYAGEELLLQYDSNDLSLVVREGKKLNTYRGEEEIRLIGKTILSIAWNNVFQRGVRNVVYSHTENCKGEAPCRKNKE